MKKYITLGIIGTIALGGIYFGGIDEISKAKLTEKYNASVEVKAKYKLDGASLVKDEIKNAELDKYKGEPKDEIKVTLGDANLQEFTPDIELKRWNEVSFKLKTNNLLKNVATKDKNLILDKDKIKFKTPKMDFEMYEATTTPEGEYKYIWYLNEKPATNKIEFAIESAGLDFFYQPPLNMENKDPNLTCMETQCKDVNGNVVSERPIDVVGSYAVYHSTKGGMVDSFGKDYKVGKAFHIFRPHIIDANGTETWGILHIENGIYSVEIPQEFLDKAVYPIKSNDTFGYAGNGASNGPSSQPRADGSLFTAPADGTITQISTYQLGWSGAFIKAIVVLHSNLNIITNGVGNRVNSGSYGPTWKNQTFATNPTMSASTDYVLMAIGSGANIQLRYDAGDTNQGHADSSNNYTTPTNPTDATHTTNKYSIYATYTPSGGGGTTVSPADLIIFE